MRVVIALLSSIVLFACGTGSPSVINDSVPADSAKKENTLAEPDTLPIEARLCGSMISIANFIDSTNGYSDDSTRLIKVYTELYGNKKIYGRTHTFYLCELGQTSIATAASMDGEQVLLKWFDSLYGENFEPVISYFFTDEGQGGFYNDGIIEQWEFKDSMTARVASEKIVFTQEIFGHDSPPAVCYFDNYMYVFISRSTPGMYAILPFFREFVMRNSASIVSRSGGWQ